MKKNLIYLIKSINSNHLFVKEFCEEHSNFFKRITNEQNVLVYDLLIKVIKKALAILEKEKNLEPKTVYKTKYWVYMEYPMQNGHCYSNGKEYIDDGSAPIVIVTDEKGNSSLAIGHRHAGKCAPSKILTNFDKYTEKECFTKNDINEEFFSLIEKEKEKYKSNFNKNTQKRIFSY